MHGAGSVELAGGDQAGDPPGDLGQFVAADAGAFASGQDVWLAGALVFIYRHRAVQGGAAQALGQFHVGYQAIATGQTIAGDLPATVALAQANGFEVVGAKRGLDPGTRPIAGGG